MIDAQRLDPREIHTRIPSFRSGLHLFLRYLPPADGISHRGVVLYVHGGTFSSALSIAHRFDGRSWRDELCAAGFHVWGLDFHGFGCFSDPYPDADPDTPLGRTADAAWLTNAMQSVSNVEILRATHLMHLEENRYALYRATEAFLTRRDD